jgi:hypothetical protein
MEPIFRLHSLLKIIKRGISEKLGLYNLIFKENCIIINCVSLRGVKTTKQSHFLQVNKEIASPAIPQKREPLFVAAAGSQ